jgi:hypothetical protein
MDEAVHNDDCRTQDGDRKRDGSQLGSPPLLDNHASPLLKNRQGNLPLARKSLSVA